MRGGMSLTHTRRRHLQLIAAAAITSALPRVSCAQSWPAKPIRVIIPFSAGSTIDIVARIVFEPLGRQLGQALVIENRGGGGGTVGAAAVARAEPDGYTLMAHSSAHVTTPAIYPNAPYDTAEDFAAVAAFGSSPNISAEILRFSAGFEALQVPFRGMPEILTEIMAGRVDFTCSTIATALPFIREGKLVALAVSTPQRSSALPDVPTTIEAGYKNSDYTFWTGLFVPAKTPREIVDKLAHETQKALDAPGVREKLAQQGMDPMPITPAAFDAQIRREIGSILALAKAANLKFN